MPNVVASRGLSETTLVVIDMTAANSNGKRLQKPYPEYPLLAHNNGQWCRKIRGKLYSFGRWPTLHGAFGQRLFDAVDHHARSQVPPNQSQQAVVANFATHTDHQYVVLDSIKEL